MNARPDRQWAKGWGRKLAAGAVMALSLVVMAGWFMQSVELVQLRANWAPMQFNTALSFLLLGTAMFLVDRFHPAVAVCAALALIVGALTVLGYVADIDFGLDRLFVDPFTTAQTSRAGRMAPSTAAAFCLSGAALVLLGVPALARRFFPIAASLGLVTTLIGALETASYLGNLTSASGWRAFTSMALTTAVAFVVAGSATAARAFEIQAQQEAPRWRWLPYCVGLVVLLASFMLWQGLGDEEIERAQSETAQVLERTRDILTDRVRSEINVIKRLSRRWSYSDKFPDKRQWDDDADILLEHFPFISGLALTDKEFVYRLSSYRGTSQNLSGRRADFNPHRKRAFDAAVASREVRVSNSVNLVQGGAGFIIVSPMLRGDKFVGLVLAGVRFSELMQSPAREYPRGYAYSVTEFGHELYRYPENSENAFPDYVQSAQIELPGTTWNIQAWPSREQMSKIRGSLPELVLLFGLVTAVLAGATLGMAQLSMARNRQLAQFTHELEAEIAERGRAEERVRKLNAELENRVQERTSELESMNRELEAFSYSVSHDLRAPLASIAGFSKMLADSHAETLGEEGMHYVRRIGSNVTRMGRLIDDLLNLGRVNRAGLKLHEVDLSALAGNIVSRLAEHDPSRRVETRIEDGLRVRADSNLIEIAVGNLLSNAWKFTAKRDPAVIEFGRERRDGREVFYVRDNGVGFDMAFAGKLFGVFQRLHSESEFPGIGVGLATVRRVLARHHGEVWATARPGEGAVFSFWLPN